MDRVRKLFIVSLILLLVGTVLLCAYTIKSTGSFNTPLNLNRGLTRGVTIHIPTIPSRRDFHQNALANFKRQSPPVDALIIFEDSTTRPSELWTDAANEDPRIRYLHTPEKVSIGKKRNAMSKLTKTNWIVNMDDDDYYGSDYVRFMLPAEIVNGTEDTDLVCLKRWPVIDKVDKRIKMYDSQLSNNKSFLYGFSHCFKTETVHDVPYRDMNFKEDSTRVIDLIDYFPNFQILAREHPIDTLHVLHVLHETNTSTVFDSWTLPDIPLLNRETIVKIEPYIT